MDNIKRVTLRLPLKLYSQIKQLADFERRSVHSQIVHMLEVHMASVMDFEIIQKRKADSQDGHQVENI